MVRIKKITIPGSSSFIESGKVGIYSFYMDNVSDEVIKKQKAVFDYLNLPLEQIEFGWEHAYILNKIVENAAGNADLKFVILFTLTAFR